MKYGSQNYGLAGPDSDEDFKLLVLPSFKEILWNKQLAIAPWEYVKYDCDQNHIGVLDIRKFHNLLLNGTYNAVEMLFSSDIRPYGFYDCFRGWFNLWEDWYKHGYVTCVWEKFLSSLKGAALESMKKQDNKGCARAWYFALLANQVVRNDFTIDENSWRNDKLTEVPRQIRFSNFKGFDWHDPELLKLKFKQAEVFAAENYIKDYDRLDACRHAGAKLTTELENKVKELLYEIQYRT